jgi:hypothetical protein
MLAFKRLSRIDALQTETTACAITNDDTALPSLGWHESALNEAEQALADGEARFIDWTTAKDVLIKGNAVE